MSTIRHDEQTRIFDLFEDENSRAFFRSRLWAIRVPDDLKGILVPKPVTDSKLKETIYPLTQEKNHKTDPMEMRLQKRRYTVLRCTSKSDKVTA